MIELPKNTIYNIEEFGVVEILPMRVKDSSTLIYIASLTTLTDREAACKILAHQATGAHPSLDQMRSLPDAKLQEITRQFIQASRLKLPDALESDIFQTFRKILLDIRDKENELLRKLLPQQGSAQKLLQAISIVDRVAPFPPGYLEHINRFRESLLKSSGFVNDIVPKALQDQLELQRKLIATAVTPLKKMFSETQQQMQKWFNQHRPIFDDFATKWVAIEKQYRVSEKEAALVLRKYKWFLCPSMYADSIFQVIKIARKPGRKDREINRWFLAYWSENNWQLLEAMVNGWQTNKLMAKRMRAIKSCLYLLKGANGLKANVALAILPTLIAQIDGYLSDYMKEKKIPFQAAYEDAGKGEKARKGRKSQFSSAVPCALSEEMEQTTRALFLDILLQHSRTGEPLKVQYNFNRHKIMHGESVNYGRLDFVIKAFMLLDYLAFLQ